MTVVLETCRWDEMAKVDMKSLLRLRFGGVEHLEMNGFNHQNAINGCRVNACWSERLRQEVLEVELIQGFGVGCKFSCRGAEVLSLGPEAR
jgi:hypothetical protein